MIARAAVCRGMRSGHLSATRRVQVVRAQQRMFTDEQWNAAIQGAAAKLRSIEISQVETEAADGGVAVASTTKEGRVFSDEEWDAAVANASGMLEELQMMTEAREDLASGEALASGEGEGSGSVAPAAATRTVPEGRMFSDEEWDTAMKNAEVLLAGMAAREGEEATGGEGQAAAQPRPEGRMFSDEEWESAMRTAGKRLTVLENGTLVGDLELTGQVPKDALAFQDVMAFSGPAPELVNARLAMLGFLAAVSCEAATGQSVVAQLQSAPAPIMLTIIALAGASLVPILSGADMSEAFGPFSPQAEKLNGRLAMIGMSALLVLEAAQGSALF